MENKKETEKISETGFKADLEKLIGKTGKLFKGYDVFLIIFVLSVFTKKAVSSIGDNFIRNRVIDELVKLLEEQR